MKLSDYIVSFLIENGVTDVFGYPGGMITHLMDSFEKFKGQVTTHVNYNEQGASFCACGYAQATHKIGIAYSSSGPGATNMVTGIANAFFDSIPCVFITGQVNTYESKGSLCIKQKGFQEMDIVSVVKSITKYAKTITDANDIKMELEKAFYISMSGRPGPVLLDIPMDISRAEIEPNSLLEFWSEENKKRDYSVELDIIKKALSVAKKPVIIAGRGIDSSGMTREFRKLIKILGIPVVSSMISRDVLHDCDMYFGFLGAYGSRSANFIVSNCDLILSMGSRIDCRQTGSNLDIFAKNAKIIRVDIDECELTNKIKTDEIDLIADLRDFIPELNKACICEKTEFKQWISVCKQIKGRLQHMDKSNELDFIEEFSEKIPDDTIITTDVGQNQVWVAQAFNLKENQKMLFSGGLGAMGYSLPAAIGACIGSGKKAISFNGDGGLQMNIQELQFVSRERLPIKIVLLNNHSLGMMRHFQEMYFDSKFVQTTEDGGYTNPEFKAIADAYKIDYIRLEGINDIAKCIEYLSNEKPCLIEINLSNKTYLLPKLAVGKPIHDQEPLMDRKLFNELMEMCDI